ncbi:hypothetical protein L195_g060660, partial [Trifolium pratense]
LSDNPSSGSSTRSFITRAKNIPKDGFTWCASSGSSSFWFTPWTTLGLHGTLVSYVDIHDLHLSVKDVISKLWMCMIGSDWVSQVHKSHFLGWCLVVLETLQPNVPEQ